VNDYVNDHAHENGRVGRGVLFHAHDLGWNGMKKKRSLLAVKRKKKRKTMPVAVSACGTNDDEVVNDRGYESESDARKKKMRKMRRMTKRMRMRMKMRMQRMKRAQVSAIEKVFLVSL
jgi:hypothetical protein